MRTKRLVLLLTLALALIVTSACGPRAITPPATQADENALVVQLPAINLDVAADGKITPAEGPLSQALPALGVDLANLSMSAETVQKLTDAGVKHLQIENLPEGMYLFMNGEPLPTLVWDQDSLASLATLLPTLGVDLGSAGKLLPLLPNLGFGVVLRLPGGTGASAPPLAKGVRPATGGDDMATALGQPAAIDLALNYAADGSFQLQGLNPFMLGMIPADALRQTPDALKGITDRGIESLSITARPTGLVIQINGQPAIYLRSTDQAQLLNTIMLLLGIAGGQDQVAQMGGMIQSLLPSLWAQGLRLTVNFPAA
jgi:hypothetical protein